MSNEVPLTGRLPGGPEGRLPLRNDLSRLFLLGATSIVIAATVVAAAGAGGARLAPDHTLQLRRSLAVATAIGGVGVFALCLARWRQVGERAALWAGTATLVLGLAVAARPELATALSGGHGPDVRFLTALSDAGFVLGPLLFAAGLVSAFDRRPVSPVFLVGSALALAAALAWVFRAVPSLGPALDLSRLSSGRGAATTSVGALSVAGWIALAAGYAMRGLRRHWLYTWGALTLFAMTLAGLASALGDGATDAWAVGGPALETLGVTLALVACSAELARAYQAQTYRLFDSELDAEAAAVRERLRVASVRSEHHALANAITAIEGAAMILEREFDGLTADDRATFARVLESGTARLRHLITAGGTPGDRVSLSAAAGEVAADSKWEQAVVLEMAPELVGAGSHGETREALRQILDFAQHRAPTGGVTVRGERDGDWVVLHVEDRGPDMSRSQRLAVADSPAHPGAAARLDDGPGLRVAARLMRRQGGDLWVEAREGGGASFGICLPAAAADDNDDEVHTAGA